MCTAGLAVHYMVMMTPAERWDIVCKCRPCPWVPSTHFQAEVRPVPSEDA